MGELTLFFDKNVGKRLPEALSRLDPPFNLTWFVKERFPDSTPDDVWMQTAGAKKWTVIGHDKKFHLLDVEALAVRQHSLGCFYMAREQGPRWDKCKLFMRVVDRLIEKANTTPRPFIYRVTASGRFVAIPI